MQAMRDEAARELQTAKPAPKPPVSAPPPAGAPIADPSYGNKVAAAIRSKIVLPDNLVGNPEAVFEVIQLPTREVLPGSVRLRKSSGNKALDEAWERAIYNASPLPPPDRPGQFQRELILTFRPKD
jgi:colicin import membrane protein